MIQFVVPGAPVPKGRVRGSGRNFYTPRKTREAEQRFTRIAAAAMHGVEHGVEHGLVAKVGIRFSMPTPKSWTRQARDEVTRKITYHTKRPDLDNLIKLALDAMTKAGWWADDAAVGEIFAFKLYGDPGQTDVYVDFAQ